MENQPLTSVVLLTFHTGPILEKAIASVLKSTVPLELIVVNNCNPPEVESKLKAMAEAEPRITFITGHGNVGFAKGCNIGAKAAKGNFLLFLNPDCLLPPDAIQMLYAEEALIKPPFMLTARLLNQDGTDQVGHRRALLTPQIAVIQNLHLQKLFPTIKTDFNKAPLPKKTSPVPAVSGAFIFMRSYDFFAINGFDEGYFFDVEDMDLCYRFRAYGGEIYFVPTLSVIHVGGTSNASKLELEKHRTRGYIRYFYNNFSDAYAQPLLWAVDLIYLAKLWVKIARAKVLSLLNAKKKKVSAKPKKA